ITSFDVEELDRAPAAAPPPDAVLAGALPSGQTRAALPATNISGVDLHGLHGLHGRRLIVLFFDLSSMQPDETQRAVKAAHEYLDRQLTPADLDLVASVATALR